MTHDPSDPSELDDVVEAFLDRQRRGERPTLEEYVRAYPHLADRLREVVPALAVMEAFASPDGTRPAAPPVPADAPPERLGEFRILREVGRGGMGVVYEAVQESLGRHVALKVLPAAVRDDAAYLERFRREAQSAARLHHSGIVPVFCVGEEGGVWYYAMQYIAGQTLASVLHEVGRLRQAGPPTVALAASVAHGLAEPEPAAPATPTPAGGLDATGAGRRLLPQRRPDRRAPRRGARLRPRPGRRPPRRQAG